jgi:predicted nucleic acid-binding protein
VKVFVDTNLIVYAHDAADPVKQDKALELLSTLMTEGTGVVSTQVFSEFAHVALVKLGLSEPVVRHQLHLMEAFTVITVTPEMIRRALEIRQLYTLNFWDSQILATAEASGCREILSEDLNPGQFYSGCVCTNPFSG